MLFRLFVVYLILVNACTPCLAQVAHRYDVVMDELFPDPTPVIGLPDAEFIELKNTSANALDLMNWKISDGSSTATIKTSFILQPDSFVVICPSSAAAVYAPYGQVIGVSNFPSLNNDGDVISLQSPEGVIIHVVAYDKTWYHNDLKSDGGWTLEMIDTKNACSGYTNWKASVSDKGGTPGQKNTVDEINGDTQPPLLLRTYSIDSITLVAVFDEPLDSNRAAINSNYQFDNPDRNPILATPLGPMFNEVVLKMPVPFEAKTVYQLTANHVTDCSGNESSSILPVKAGLPSPADSTDIVVNEILFNPKTGGYDYVEFYNRSNKIAELKQLFVANRNAAGGLSSIQQCSITPYLFFPGEYLVMTENSLSVQQNYIVKNPAWIKELPSLPSLPDDIGNIILLNQQGNTVDELHYDHKWHFGLISDEAGVALERMDYNLPTQNAANWTSAAATAGYGTPTYQNSELTTGLSSKAAISIAQKLFSPDNDGYEDFCMIDYQLSEPGYVANINIFDASGRQVRYLAKNSTLALTGSFRWDGLDDVQRKLPVGIYIIVTEIFNLQGKTKQFKNTVTLAGRL